MFSFNYETFTNLEEIADRQLLNLEILQIIWQEKSEGALVI